MADEPIDPADEAAAAELDARAESLTAEAGTLRGSAQNLEGLAGQMKDAAAAKRRRPRPVDPPPAPGPIVQPPQPPQPPDLAILADTLIAGRDNEVSVRAMGMPNFNWAVFENKEPFTWLHQGKSVPVATDGPTKIVVPMPKAGLKLKVYGDGIERDSTAVSVAEQPPAPPPPVPPAPTPAGAVLEFDTKELKGGQRNVVNVRCAGMPGFQWAVFEDVAPHYTWLSSGNTGADPSGVTRLDLDLPRAGLKVKVLGGGLERNSVASQSGDVVVPPPGPAPGPAPQPVGAKARDVLFAKMGLGTNQERFTGVSHDTGKREYWRYYIDTLGFRQVRFFFPFNPKEQWFARGDEGYFREYMNRVRASCEAGMPVVWIDCADVLGDWHLDHNFIATMNAHFEMCARVVAEYNLPREQFMVGAVNEYGAGKNPLWQPHRERWNDTFRRRLPGYAIVEGPCTWKDPRALFNDKGEYGDYVPWADPEANTLQDVHQYMGWDTNGMAWVAGEARKFADRHGTKVIAGEWGFGSGWEHLSIAENPGAWKERFTAEAERDEIAGLRPFLWANTDGNAWRMNQPGSNRIRTDLGEGAVRDWSRRIDARTGH